MGKKDDKTNVMRILEQKKVTFKYYHLQDATGEMTGVELAESAGFPVDQTFKTLVTRGKSKHLYVFVIPVAAELDLKKAAAAVGEKSISMILSRELLPETGYIHGGCSPIGMKKQYPTTFHISAENYEEIYFSAGKIGYQVCVKPMDLEKIIPLRYCDVTISLPIIEPKSR